MKPTFSIISYIDKTVTGYCDLWGLSVVIRHEQDLDGELISRFRLANHYHDAAIVHWKHIDDQTLDELINHINKSIYTDAKRSAFDNIDITREIDILRNRPCVTTKNTTCTIVNVIFNPPATIVFWSDKTKTVVKCLDGDAFDREKGLTMAIAKKMNGNTGAYFNVIKKWVSVTEELCED
jgi:hypothetical protein